jgi:CHAD domain-containing protein
MSYTIQSSEAFYAEIKRVVNSQTDMAIHSLMEEKNVHEAVHDARKRCKKIRAAWRLIRDDLGEAEYKARNVWFRDTSRLISDMRDATAVMEALELLRAHFGEVVYKSAFDRVAGALDEKRRCHEATEEEMRPEQIHDAVERLQYAKENVNGFELRDMGWKGVVRSIRRVYRRGYKAFGKVRGQPTVEGIHEWRKRTKYLRYQLRLLKRVWPGMFNSWRDELHDLSDIQGDHHDMDELKAHLDRLENIPTPLIQTIKGIAVQLQEQLYLKAIPLGQKLYAEKPDAFARRMGQYLEAWEIEPEGREETAEEMPGSEVADRPAGKEVH